jgi:hypothetical protein
MHELLLYGQVPAARHDQVLKILAGLAAMQPLRVLERCIIYKPQREPEEPGLNVRRGGTQNIALKQGSKPASAAAALYYTKLIQKLSEEDFGAEHGQPLSANVKDGEDAKWLTRWEDQPDTGDRGVSIRFTNTTDLLSGDPHAHMIATGPNRYALQYTSDIPRLNPSQLRHRVFRRRTSLCPWQRRCPPASRPTRAWRPQPRRSTKDKATRLRCTPAARLERRIHTRGESASAGLQGCCYTGDWSH